MQIFELLENSNLFNVPFDWDEDDRNISYIRGVVEHYFEENRRVDDKWNPQFFGVLEKRMKVGDIGILSGSEMVVFSQRAVEKLMHLLADSVELLPYPTEIGTYYLVNVLDEGDYLDRQRTDCDEILPNGHCFGINRYMFVEERLRGKHIFRIPDDAVTRFVSGEFIEVCKQHDLQGIYLTDRAKVWDSQAV
jgi:hypothetical protein